MSNKQSKKTRVEKVGKKNDTKDTNQIKMSKAKAGAASEEDAAGNKNDGGPKDKTTGSSANETTAKKHNATEPTTDVPSGRGKTNPNDNPIEKEGPAKRRDSKVAAGPQQSAGPQAKATNTTLAAKEPAEEAAVKTAPKKPVVPMQLDQEGLEELQALPEVVMELHEMLENLAVDVDEVKVILGAVSEAVDTLEEKHETHWDQLVWRVDFFYKKFKQAKNSTKPILYSPSFETRPRGVRLALSLCPYGDGKARGQYMSLFFCILRGDYDTLHAWPFSQKITFTLVSQAEDEENRIDRVTTFMPNTVPDNMPFLGKPVKARNPSLGLPRFAIIEDLWTDEFVKDDTLFIRVKVDMTTVIAL